MTLGISFELYSSLLEKRLAIMRMLATALEGGKDTYGAGDPDRLLRSSVSQQELCRQWGQLEEELHQERLKLGWAGTTVRLEHASHSGPSSSVMEELVQVEARLRHLLRVHAALLRRMRRSIAIMAHVLASDQPTYVAGSKGEPIGHGRRI